MSEREKREGAMRIFEALSGVDEQYLEACERDTGGQAADGRGKKVIPFAGLARFSPKYGKFVAAALVFGVVGAGYLGMHSLRMGKGASMSTNMATMDQAVQQAEVAEDQSNGMAAGSGMLQGEAAAKADSSVEEMPETAWEVALEAAPEAVSGASSDESMLKDNVEDQVNSVDRNAGVVQSSNGRSQEKTVPEVYACVPKVWPQGCVTEQHWVANKETQGETAQYLEVSGSYPDRQETFTLRIMDLGEQMPGADRIGKTYTEAEFDESCVTKELASGAGDFGVLYQTGDHYVLVRFIGSGTAKEVWEMMASIRP